MNLISNPSGLNDCRWCHEQCMDTEEQEGQIRIYSLCDEAINAWAERRASKDDIRTLWAEPSEAVKQWNAQNS